MKKTLLSITALSLFFLYSCKTPIELPKNLSKSRLLVLKYEELPVPENGGGLKKWGYSRYNKAVASNNAKLEKAFIKYPFEYKMVTEEEIADHMQGAETVYILKNGKTALTTAAKVSRVKNAGIPVGGGFQIGGNVNARKSNDKKTEIVLENATLHRKKILGKSKTGTASFAGKFVHAAIKNAPKKKSPKTSAKKR